MEVFLGVPKMKVTIDDYGQLHLVAFAEVLVSVCLIPLARC